MKKEKIQSLISTANLLSVISLISLILGIIGGYYVISKYDMMELGITMILFSLAQLIVYYFYQGIVELAEIVADLLSDKEKLDVKYNSKENIIKDKIWICKKCNTEVDEEFEICWNCMSSKDAI